MKCNLDNWSQIYFQELLNQSLISRICTQQTNKIQKIFYQCKFLGTLLYLGLFQGKLKQSLSQQKSFMGQDICTNVNICVNPLDAYIVEPTKTDKTHYIDNSQKENREDLSQQPVKQVEPLPSNQQEKQSQQAQTDDLDIFAMITQKLGSFLTPKQIILNIDEAWISQPKLFNEGEGFRNYYQQIKDSQYSCYSVFQRNGIANAKTQILFQQHIPFTGVFFFKIYLIQYQIQKGLCFVIGIADYLQAVQRRHSKDSGYEQSFMLKILPSEITTNPSLQQVENIKKRIQFTVECIIDRLEKKIILRLPENFKQIRNKMKIYGNDNQELQLKQGQLEIGLKIKTSLLDSAVSLSPYIQTQYTGLVLGWDKYESTKSANYKLSTIIEEGSSIISTV